ncbi:uncharacterized protein LOC126682632 isoform X1 [Mercurialis annua]|uniref:uncharacterized protein LOC126682632 isoform X1 n=1 Tax=Mercurialis annua TaxID=3986 RepID=UPI00215E0493|nr:uncharacterized protein LOC126682632 isoform X1 [Mercurialis annua]
MVLQSWSCASYPNVFAPQKPTNSKFRCFSQLGIPDVVEITHNKLLIAAAVSAAIGQLSKPFTSILFYGKDFDFRTAFGAGGFPSTHSSAVVATATSLALERGFSDSIFGLTVVYAGLVMYDAQGVRREVGNHARMLNKMQSKMQFYSKDDDDLIVSQRATAGEQIDTSLSKGSRNAPLLLKSLNQKLISSVQEETGNTLTRPALLKESIGHSEVEVIAGAFLGFLVTLAVYATL